MKFRRPFLTCNYPVLLMNNSELEEMRRFEILKISAPGMPERDAPGC